MTRLSLSPDHPRRPAAQTPPSPSLSNSIIRVLPQEFKSADVASHNTEEDCWVTLSVEEGGPFVYDITKYLDEHPGGAEVLLDVAGQDATDQFEDIGHSGDARKELGNYKIGILKMSKEEIEKIAKEKEAKLLAAKNGGGMMPILAVLVVAVAIGYYVMTQ
ncbi:hypothetical protein TL16_g04051 [Triparma laevis f. inornata]|uniref:Cytochrome b5 heme-binding domain-containing protein n=1 Tax=Triparma laevis f. inornata TaxID=1714386 RepID=A0A9W7E3W3_9STRA|nr:hypothetical protein TL16_g04051 [Triparma laevis f. inornata]